MNGGPEVPWNPDMHTPGFGPVLPNRGHWRMSWSQILISVAPKVSEDLR